LPPQLAAAIQNALRRGGYEVHPFPAPADQRRTTLLRRRGITLVLDVGANAGQYSQRLRDSGYTGRIVSFEPASASFALLERRARDDPGWEPRRVALGDEDGEAEFNLAANTYSSSLLPMRSRHLDSDPHSGYVGAEAVPTARLESIWKELCAPTDRVWLKLDVQGYELHVLRGAESALEAVDVVQAEMALVPLYEGDVSWHDLVGWLQDHGLRLAGLEPGFEDPETGELLQADGIFVRT
jgi:FkbM family methyltransferase